MGAEISCFGYRGVHGGYRSGPAVPDGSGRERFHHGGSTMSRIASRTRASFWNRTARSSSSSVTLITFFKDPWFDPEVMKSYVPDFTWRDIRISDGLNTSS